MAKNNPNLRYYRDVFKYAERREELIRKAFEANSKAGSRRYRQMLTRLDQGYVRYNGWQIQKKDEKTSKPSKYSEMKKMAGESFKISRKIDGVSREFQFHFNVRGDNLAEAIHKASKSLSVHEKEELIEKLRRDIEEERQGSEEYSGDEEALKVTDQYDELIDGILRNGKIPYKAKDKLKNNTIFKTELIAALVKKYNEGNIRSAFRRASSEMRDILADRGISNKYVDKITKKKYVKF